MNVLALIGLCVVLAWGLNGMHREGMQAVRIVKRRERESACYPFRSIR